ncbi:microtubule-actin cross-linking factor 1-like isoform X2 [Panonychus citri]|uniref:microtubule-actin cross-linking factor 1-like isoform X2 n=1 Tax=Panonychus citri TaxID=50023 RepID=UPI002307C960|nr:microtubule-actin cross-linking factor 1-like isoform X2 [Panonychus citri]
MYSYTPHHHLLSMLSRSHSPSPSPTRPPSRVSCEFDSWYQELGIHSIDDIPERCSSLIEWTKTKPLFMLRLDPVDRAVLRIADERDEIQKKTFTKWVNKHLIKANRRVIDLFEDLRDGENLVSLLEVLSQKVLPRERGRMRVHMLQNVQNALDFLKRRRIKLVNIRPDDIVDSNQKLTLGLIWTIILHYQLYPSIQRYRRLSLDANLVPPTSSPRVNIMKGSIKALNYLSHKHGRHSFSTISDIIQHDESTTFKEALLKWAQKTTEGYPGVKVTDFTNSWKDGLAFNAILHRNRPDLLEFRDCASRNNRDNLENAFQIGERDLGVTRLLEPEDVDTKNIDEKSMITYISSLYELFPEPPERNPYLDDEKLRQARKEFDECYENMHSWLVAKDKMIAALGPIGSEPRLVVTQKQQCQVIREEFKSQESSLERLEKCGDTYKRLLKYSSSEYKRVDDRISDIRKHWSSLLSQLSERERALAVAGEAARIAPLIDWLNKSEKRLKAMLPIPTDQELIRQRISEHRVLHQDILDHKKDFKDLTEIAQNLVSLVGDDEAQMVVDRLRDVTDRYAKLVKDSENLKHLLSGYHESLGAFVLSFEDILAWITEMDSRLSRFRVLSVYSDKLREQLDELSDMNQEINDTHKQVVDVNNMAQKVIKHASSEDIIQVKDKLNALNGRFDDLSHRAVEKLRQAQDALPLCDNFHSAHDRLNTWLDESESALDSFSTLTSHAQESLIQRIESALPKYGSLLDQVNSIGPQLALISPGQGAATVDGWISRANKRFEKIAKRQRELGANFQESMAFEQEIQDLLNWLDDIEGQFAASKPAGGLPESAREQLNKFMDLYDELLSNRPKVDSVLHRGQDYVRRNPDGNFALQQNLKGLKNKWDSVLNRANDLKNKFEGALKNAKQFHESLQKFIDWLSKSERRLQSMLPIPTDQELIRQRMSEHRVLHQDILDHKKDLKDLTEFAQNLVSLVGDDEAQIIVDRLRDVTDRYAKLVNESENVKHLLSGYHESLETFVLTFEDILAWITEMDSRLNRFRVLSVHLDKLREQLDELSDMNQEINDTHKQIVDVNNMAQKVMKHASEGDVIQVKDKLSALNCRFDDLSHRAAEKLRQAQDAFPLCDNFHSAHDRLNTWLDESEKALDSFTTLTPHVQESTIQKIEAALPKYGSLLDQVNSIGPQLALISPGQGAATVDGWISRANKRFEKIAKRQRELGATFQESLAFNQEIQDLLNWLDDIEGQFVASKPVGGLPETAREQLDKFMDLFAELNSKKPTVESVLHRGQEYVRRSPENNAELSSNLKTLKTRWDSVVNRANDLKIKLEIALRDANEFHEALQQFTDWLTSAEKYLNNMGPVSLVVEHILPQIEEHKNFQKDVSNHRETMLNLDKKGTHLKYFSQKQDVILIKNLLVSVQHRWERVVGKAAERTRALDRGYKEAREFHDAWSSLISWLKDAEESLDTFQPIGNDPERIKLYLNKHKEFQRSLGAKQSTYDATIKLGRALKDKCPKSDVPILNDMIEELKKRWNSACAKSVDRQRKLEEALLFSGQFKDAVQALIDWLEKTKGRLGLDNIHGDLDTVTVLVEQHKALQEDLKSRRGNMATVKKTASDLLESATPTDAALIREQIATLDSRWDEVVKMSDAKQRCLEDALRQAEELHKAVHSLLEWLSDAEMKLRFSGPLPEDEETTKQQIMEHEVFMREMSKQEMNKDSTISLAENILAKCHPDAVSVIRHWITIIKSRWEEVSGWAKQRETKLREHLESLRGIMNILEELLNWLRKAEANLLAAESEPLPDDIESLEGLIEEHQKFIDEMSSKQPEVERVTKAFSSTKRQTKSVEVKGRRSTSKTRVETPVNGHSRTSTSSEPEIKNPKARELVEKWRSVWLLAMERMRRLQDKLDYIREVERVKNFEFDEWRRRFLGWMNNKKARVMDFFRKIDKDNDGKVTQEDFIEGFLESKFPTSRLEMERVAPIFDRNSDGFIDHKEYLETLRPDRDLPKTEAEIIQDEVQRQVSKCTCVHRYKVFQVGEGKYRFGDSQKLRLVRILRSTVMVRVGGGWVSLDEFLIKNDPCRDCLELEFFLPCPRCLPVRGISVFPEYYRPLAPDYNSKIPVPIMSLIREKTELSVPMSRSFRFGGSTSDCSFSDTDSGSKSRPGSRMAIKK